MLNWKAPFAVALSMGLWIAVGAQAQQTSDTRAVTVSPLTPLDYIEIRQLVARYAYAVDTGADNGYVYASLFAPDGAFLDRTGRATSGRETLAASTP